MKMMEDSYSHLQDRLAAAEAILEALYRGEVDLVIGSEQPLVVRFKSLVEENERLVKEWQTTFDAIKDAICIIDSERHIIRYNSAMQERFGTPDGELRGQPCWMVVHGSDSPVADCPFMNFGLHPSTNVLRFKRDDRWFDESVYLIRDKGQKLSGAVCVIADITSQKTAEEERARLQEQLLQSQKMESIGRLAGGVAHDFNNLLSVILGYGQLMLAKLEPSDPFFNPITKIVEAGKKSAALTRQLLAFSRKQTMQPEILDLNEVLRHLEDMLSCLIGEDIELIFQLEPQLGKVSVDPSQIEQVILNLVVNARDAMPQGGRLTISTANIAISPDDDFRRYELAPGVYTLLSVRDTGCGMSKEVMAHIFEPFYTTKAKGQGTGLGLATVYGIVKQSGGDIQVFSEEGKGSTFEVYLPHSKAAIETNSSATTASVPSGGQEHILIVEDDENLRGFLHQALTELGYQVSLAANGKEAVMLVEGKGARPDLVITDVIMPAMSGKALVERLRQSHSQIKVLFMSGYTKDNIAHRGLMDSSSPFIQKPFDVETIAAQIRTVLG